MRPSAGEVKGGRRAARVELAVATDSLVRRQRLDLDAPLPQLLDCLRVGTHLPVRTHAHDEPLRQLLEDVAEIGKHQSVPIRPPPVGEHTLGEHDHVARLLLTVDDEVTESVSLDPRHRLTSRSSLRSSPCRAWKIETLTRIASTGGRAAGLLSESGSTRRATPAGRTLSYCRLSSRAERSA